MSYWRLASPPIWICWTQYPWNRLFSALHTYAWWVISVGIKSKKLLDWRRVLPIVWRIHCLALCTLVWYALIFYTAELEPYAKPLPERHWKLILERGWQTCLLIQNKLTIFWKHRCQDFIYLRVMYTLLMRGQIPQLSFPPVSLHNCGDCGAHCAYAVFSFFKEKSWIFKVNMPIQLLCQNLCQNMHGAPMVSGFLLPGILPAKKGKSDDDNDYWPVGGEDIVGL